MFVFEVFILNKLVLEHSGFPVSPPLLLRSLQMQKSHKLALVVLLYVSQNHLAMRFVILFEWPFYYSQPLWHGLTTRLRPNAYTRNIKLRGYAPLVEISQFHPVSIPWTIKGEISL